MLTKNQRVHLMAELWPNACAFQGWNVGDDDFRYEFFAHVLGDREPHRSKLARGGHISANDFIKTDLQDDFGDVKRELLLMAGKHLTGRDPVRATWLWIVRERLGPCLRLYSIGAETILRERFKRFPGLNTVEDLGDRQLQQLVWTLEARVNAARNKAGDTHHQMCLKAGVKLWKPCPKGCPLCYMARAEAGQTRPAPASSEAVREAVLAEVEEEGEPF